MPKLVKQTKHTKPTRRPSDPSLWARQLVDESTSESETATLPTIHPAALSAYMSAIGRKGGKIGGKRRLETLTDERRSEIASQAARAMWAKRKRLKKR
jgi:predicted transcriptional regulator